MKLFSSVILTCLLFVSFGEAIPVRLVSTINPGNPSACHIGRVYQSDNGFAFLFTDCSVVLGGTTYSTFYYLTNFSDGWSKAMFSTVLAAKASKTGLNITYDNAILGNSLYSLSIMKSSDHNGSMALKLLDIEIKD